MRAPDLAAWLRRPEPRPGADLRLYCFPWSGAGTSAYRELAARLPAEIETVTVQLPGRGARAAETPRDNTVGLAIATTRAILRDLRRHGGRFAMFGHSFGALLGYEVVRRLAAERWFPELLVVSGSRTPEDAPPVELHRLSDPELLDHLVLLGGMPGNRLADGEFIERFLPVVRADLTACERHQRADCGPVAVPVSAWAGAGDWYATPELVDGWRRFAAGEFRGRTFGGGHFFLTDVAATGTALLDDLAWARQETALVAA